MLSEGVSVNNLPDHLLQEISLRVADNQFSDIGILERVSKSFFKHANSKYVLRRYLMAKLPYTRSRNDNSYSLWDLKPLRHLSKRPRRFRRAGNVEALYRTGLQNYFSPKSSVKRRQRGFEQFVDAASKGNRPARYVYGLILLCICGESKTVSTSYLVLSHTMEETGNISESIRTVLWMERPTARELITRYVRDRCNCRLTSLLPRGRGWDGYGDMSDKLISTSTLCRIGLWDHEIIQSLYFSLY